MIALSEEKDSSFTNPLFSKPLRAIASLVSYVFHPLFIPVIFTYYLAFINPIFFTGFTDKAKLYVLVWVFINMVFFPAVSVLLLKAVGFIDSIFLKTQKDRIIPYIAANLFYFWMFLVFHNNTMIPVVITSFVLGVFLTSSCALILNIYFKISMHAMGMGGLVGILLIILFKTGFSVGFSPALIIVIILSGIVCTSRLIISDHSSKEIYAGFLVGVVFQYVAAMYVIS